LYSIIPLRSDYSRNDFSEQAILISGLYSGLSLVMLVFFKFLCDNFFSPAV